LEAKLLNKPLPALPPPDPNDPENQNQRLGSSAIRNQVTFWNWFRLLLVRIRKLMKFLSDYLDELPFLKSIFKGFVEGTDAVFSWAAWICFLPRLYLNLF